MNKPLFSENRLKEMRLPAPVRNHYAIALKELGSILAWAEDHGEMDIIVEIEMILSLMEGD